MELMTKRRNSLPESAFALGGRHYPIHDEAHARNALARSARFATPDEHARIVAKVRKRCPRIQIDAGMPK